MTDIRSYIVAIQSQLESAYPAKEAEALAWWIAEELSGQSRTELLFGCKDTTFFQNTQEIVSRLLHFEPIQYIFGHTLWCGLDLKLTPATLIPRPETAELVTLIADCFARMDDCKVLDIGTGSGCIALALKKLHPEWQVTGMDISAEAIAVAKENARRNKLEADFQIADIFHSPFPVFHSYDIVVSNPPYICEKEKSTMRANVLHFEPSTALFVPDDDPLLFYRRIAEQFALSHSEKCRKKAYLFFEINEAYSDETKQLLESAGYSDIRIYQDMYGKPRFVSAEMKKCT